jgi:hypothetical protein
MLSARTKSMARDDSDEPSVALILHAVTAAPSAFFAERKPPEVVPDDCGVKETETHVQHRHHSLKFVAGWSLIPATSLGVAVCLAAPAQAFANFPVILAGVAGLATAIAALLIRTDD